MRERIFVDEKTPATVPNWYKYGSSLIINDQLSYFSSERFSGMCDVVTPNFSRVKNEGNLVNNPMERLTYDISRKPTILRGKGDCGGGLIHEYELADFIPTLLVNKSSLVETVANALRPYSAESEVAQTKAWANIDVSEIQGSASLGELPETVDWLIETMRALAELVVALRRKDVKKLRKILKKQISFDGAMDLWLQYRYAIRPLVSEVVSALSALSASLEKGTRFTARGNNYIFDEPLTTTAELHFTNGALAADFCGYVATVTKASERMFRAGVLVEIDTSINAGLAIWGLDSPVEAIWELMSLSFIMDWFFNIGSCINAAFLNPGLEPRISWVTEKINYYQSTAATGLWRNSPAGCSQNIESWRLIQYGYTYEGVSLIRRVPLSKRFSLPHLNVRLSPDKILDIFAIARKLL